MSPQKILITGAGSGLGLALAQRHAARGDAVLCAPGRLSSRTGKVGSRQRGHAARAGTRRVAAEV